MKETTSISTYAAAYEALQQIMADLQSETTNIDELPAKIERASELIRFCREHLRRTEEVVKRLADGEIF